MQPRHRHRRAARRPTATAGVNRLSFGVQSMVAHVLAALGPHPRPGERASGRSASARGAGLRRRSTSTSSTAAPASRSTTGAARSTRSLALEPPHVSAYALTVEAGHAAGRRPGPPSRRRRPGRQVPAGRRALRRRPGSSWYEISNWARPGHECRHNLLYWAQGDYRGVRLRRPLAPRRSAVVERAHARALHRRHRARVGRRGRRRGARRRDPARRGPAAGAADAPRACPPRRCRSTTRTARPTCWSADGDRAVLTVDGRLLANEVALRLR